MNFCQWLDVSESEENEVLLAALAFGHRHAAVTNQNLSSVSVRLGAAAGVSFESSVASAVLPFGAKQAPIPQARKVIYQTSMLELEEKIQQADPSRLNAVALKKIERVFGKLPPRTSTAPPPTPRLRALQ